jgi:hypothetical protein
MGPEMPERGLKTPTVPFVWTTFGICSFGTIQMISCRDWWRWTKPGYVTMTRSRRQSNSQWSGDIAAHLVLPPKNPSAKILWKSSRLEFLGSRRYPPHWLSYKGPNYQRGVLLISAGENEGHFEETTPRRGKVTYGGLFLHNSRAHRALATQKKLAYLGFQFLDHPPYSPDLATLDYYLFPGLKKLKCYHFSSDKEVIAAAETWFDGQPSDFLWGLGSVLCFVGSILNKSRVWSL